MYHLDYRHERYTHARQRQNLARKLLYPIGHSTLFIPYSVYQNLIINLIFQNICSFVYARICEGQRSKPRVLAAPSFTEGGDLPMGLIISLLKLAAAAVGLATAVVKAVSAARGERPETKAGRKRL